MAVAEFYAVGFGEGELAHLQGKTLETPAGDGAVVWQAESDIEKILEGWQNKNLDFFVRVNGILQETVVKRLFGLALQPKEVSALSYVDLIHFPARGREIDPRNPRYQPILFSVFDSAVTEMLAAEKILLRRPGSGIVICSGQENLPKMRASVLALAKLGLHPIQICHKDTAETAGTVASVQKLLPGVQFEIVERDELTQLAGTGVLAISLVESTETELLEDLSYINFLKPQAVLLDASGALEKAGFFVDIEAAGAVAIKSEALTKVINSKCAHILQGLSRGLT